ncbi:MAG: hypothetical protein ABSH06_15315 [Thermodesulfobacteriota bacterium]|jgi:hypothetical protein
MEMTEPKEIKMMKTKDIEKIKRSPFKDLFPIDPDILKAVEEHMRVHGFDPSQPLIVWKGMDTLVDGYTRHEGASKDGIEEIPVYEKDFANEEEAVEYAIHNQVHRRNLTDAAFLKLVEKLDEKYKGGRPKKSAPCEATFKPHIFDSPSYDDAIDAAPAPLGSEQEREKFRKRDEEVSEKRHKGRRSSTRLGHMIGTYHFKIEMARKILSRAKLDLAGREVRKKVEDNKMTINSGYKALTKKEGKASFRVEFWDRSQGHIYVSANNSVLEEKFLEELDWMILGTGEAPDMGNFTKDSKLCFPRLKNPGIEILKRFREVEEKRKGEEKSV